MHNESVTVAVISPEPGIHDKIISALATGHASNSFWSLSEYPNPAQLIALRDAPAGCVVILDFTDPRRARSVAAELDRSYPDTTMIALYPGKPSPLDLIDLMQLGIREVVNMPITGPDISQATARAERKLMSRHSHGDATGQIYAFLPAKPGVGATTLAIHTAAAIARLTNERTLLIDLDLKLGMTSFLLKLDGSNSIKDALASGPNLDPTLWDRLVSRRGKLEILASAPAEFGRTKPGGSAVDLLEFSRQHYETICVDLPGDGSDNELEALRLAKEIFLVCSPDLGILHMARHRSEMLHSLGLGGTVSVIMNRSDSRGSLPLSDIEGILNLPVSFSVSSEYIQIAEATKLGVALEGRSPIVTQIENIARHLRPIGGARESKGRKFIELFSVTPVRERLGWKP